jgi:hypothetical protein
MRRLRRRLLTLVGLLVLLGAGYTAGFLLDQPDHQVARDVPTDPPIEAPHPLLPADVSGEA